MGADSNDIVFEQYQIDFLPLLRAAYEAVLGTSIDFNQIVSFFDTFWLVFTIVSFIFAAVLLVGLIYAYIRDGQMAELEEEMIYTQERLYKELYQGERTNTRWQDIEQHIGTDNPNDWKLAIIEADIMLDEMLSDIGYAGNTIGEKLKSASPQSFQTLDDAWEAHKVRNRIAHGGADFVLTKKIAQETITRYRRVFQEFGLV